MGNPKIYLKINKSQHIVWPVAGFIKELDKIFKDNSIIEANKTGYNSYTNDFINQCDDTNMFYSEDYSYDPKTFIFNFNEIKVCSDDDYLYMAIESSNFDPKKKYDSSTHVIEKNVMNILKDIKKNCPNPGIES